MKTFEFIYERVNKDYMKPGEVVRKDANGNVLSKTTRSKPLPTNHVNLSIKFTDPITKETWIVPTKESFRDTFIRKYNRNYGLSIPTGFLAAVTYNKYRDHLVATLKPEYSEQLKAAVAEKLAASKKTVDTPTTAKPIVQKQVTAISKGVSKADDPEHDHDLYTAFVKNNSSNDDYVDDSDEEEEKGGSSRVSKKAFEVGLNKFNPNTVLVNAEDEALIIQSFYSVPMITDSYHQQNKPFMGTDLFSKLASIFTAAPAPVVEREIKKINPTAGRQKSKALPIYGDKMPVRGWGAGESKYKIEFMDSVSMKEAESLASRAVYSSFKGKNLVLAGGKFPIHWVNPEDRDKATSFALCHWVRTPNQEYPKTGDEKALKTYIADNEIKHYVFGYYDTAGILVNPNAPEKIFGGFNVGYIEKVVGFYGTGGIVDRRLSALHPSTALGMKVGEYKTSSVNILNRSLEGLTLTQPWTQIIDKINSSYADAKNPEKAPKLVEMTEDIIGESVGSPTQYPVNFSGIELKTVGFSTNAVAVDFMEILHPLILMKPDGAINNGLYDAAMAYFGSTNLSKCKVFYPDAKNAPMFDSLLVSDDKYLMVSSKAGEGATPSITGLGTAYEALASNGRLPAQIKNKFKTLNSNPNYPQLLNFFTALQSGTSEKDLNSKIPNAAKAKKIAQDILIMKNLSGTDKAQGKNRKAWGEQIAEQLNDLDGGKFLEYCEFVMSATNLVQVNTQYTVSKDEKDFMSIDGFMATWPNAVYDKIKFSYLGSTLKFKLAVGGKAERDLNVSGPDFEKYQGYNQKGKKEALPRYASPENFRSLDIPGTKGMIFGTTRAKKDKPWYSAVQELEKKYKLFTRIYKGQDDETIAVAAEDELAPLYNAISDVLGKLGHNPSIENKTETTTRDLLAKVKQLLGN
jgi:hypothetical protein